MADWTEPCPTCGKTGFKSPLSYAGHQRSKGHPKYDPTPLSGKARRVHKPSPEPQPTAPVAPQPARVASAAAPTPNVAGAPFQGMAVRDWRKLPPVGEPAIIPDWGQVEKMRAGHRSLTMLRPICRICERKDNRRRDWWWGCTHDPYVTMVPFPETVRDWTDEVRLNPATKQMEPTGRKVEVPGSVRQIIAYFPRPNHTNRSINLRSNGGYGLSNARWKGLILPSELRSPHYPGGIVDTCQFHDCRTQTGLQTFTNGIFCRGEEAALCDFDDKGTTVEMGGRPGSEERRRDQIDARAAQLARVGA